MAAPASARELLNQIPGQDLSGRSRESTTGLTPIRAESYQDLARYLVCYMGCRVLTGHSSLLCANGATLSDVEIELDCSTGDVLLGGRFYRVPVASDVPVGTGVFATVINTAGAEIESATPVLPSATGKTLRLVVCLVALTTGAAQFVIVRGTEANDTTEVEPTEATVQTALKAAFAAGLIPDGDPTLGLIVGRIKVARTFSDPNIVITLTHTAPASNAALENERQHGCIWPAYDADGLTMPAIVESE